MSMSEIIERSNQSIEDAERMVAQARSMWNNAHESCRTAQTTRDDIREQLEMLAAYDGFRHRFANSMLPKIIEAAVNDSGADMGNIQIFEPRTSQLILCAQYGFERPFLNFFQSVHEGQAACGAALKENRRIIVPDVTRSPIFMYSPSLEIMLDARARAVQSTPLFGEAGRLVGMLSTHYRKVIEPSARDFRAIDHYSRSAASLIDWANHDVSPTAGTFAHA